jgi:hypothetical protein
VGRNGQVVPIANVGNELAEEIRDLKDDLRRLQGEAFLAKDWKKELAIIDRRVRLLEVRLRELREHSTNILSVNFDVDTKTAEKMATAFLAKQRHLAANGESDG